MTGKPGVTTGACAAAATFAAARVLRGDGTPDFALIPAVRGMVLRIPVLEAGVRGNGSFALVRKDAGDSAEVDNDVTHGALVTVCLEPGASGGIRFVAGDGVGTVTKRGLSLPPGEPAINPGPRKMICNVLHEANVPHATVTVSIRHGESLARQTYNPRLGVEGGLSVLGTTGIVRPRCRAALIRTIALSISVANAEHPGEMYMVPGNIGAAAAIRQFGADSAQIVEVENLWGVALDSIPDSQQGWIHLVGHPGKLLKLARNAWNTHSACSEPMARELASSASAHGFTVPAHPGTCEEVIQHLPLPAKRVVFGCWCDRISEAVLDRIRITRFHCNVQVFTTLVSMTGQVVGSNAPAPGRKLP